ncbi:hypothetical protein [Polyangium sp. y55x31]|uniref:hypothetical protein n=1 Tax=Polyangium sp. y55x31 TaxID=3042688 RepID=UPI0024829B67|nr:hypothetical protein [Polyangium sp. y55x31]MDI1477620.1 hypothetical protein [Polyangium sp. y55x31]
MTFALGPSAARAEGPAPATPAPAATAPRRVEVRLSISRAAAEALGGEARVRRLLEIELDDTGTLAPGPSGPLGDDVAHVWIDLPSPSEVLIEARLAERAAGRRFILIGGLNPDVAARLVAIAANELVRTQARPLRPRKAPAPRAPTPKELELAARRAPAIVWSAAPSFVFLPGSSGALWGAGASLGFRGAGVSERATARWLTGSTSADATRWFEVGLAVDYRVYLGSSVRLLFGADAALGFLHLSDVRATDGIVGTRDAFSGRAGGLLGVDVRAFGPAWLGLHLSPGAILRPTRFETRGGLGGTIEGLWLGVDLALQLEHPLVRSAPTNPR